MKIQKNPATLKEFDLEIIKIESEIVEFMAKKGLEFTGRHPYLSRIMFHFYIRKRLTQKDLQKLTGLSAGTISKVVRQLLQMNIITKDIMLGTHKHIYSMENVPFVSPRFFLSTGRYLGNVEEELKNLKKTLDQKNELKKLDRYQKIYSTVTKILSLIPLTDSFMKTLEKELM